MKIIPHMGTSDGILLLYYTLNLFSITEGWTRFTNVKVGIFVDRWKPSETSLENYGPNIANFHRATTLINVSLDIKTIPLNGLSFEEIAEAFCSDIVENNVTVIVLQTRRENFTQFVGNLASYFKIPVIDSLMQPPQLGDKVGGIIHSLLWCDLTSFTNSHLITLSLFRVPHRNRRPIQSYILTSAYRNKKTISFGLPHFNKLYRLNITRFFVKDFI